MYASYLRKLDIIKSPGVWDKLGLDFTLGKGDQIYKFIVKFKMSWERRLPTRNLDKKTINTKFFENKDGKNYSWNIFARYLLQKL